MNTFYKTATATAIFTAAMVATPASAAVIVLSLGASSQNLTVYGLGPLASNPSLGTFRIGQGSSTYDGATNTSTFMLTGAIAGGTAGYNSGTYSLITTYSGLDSPLAGPNAPGAQTNPSNLGFFNYNFLHPSTTVTLTLFLPSGTFVQPLFGGNAFTPGSSYSFTYSGTLSCTGIGALPCTQNNVGLTSGATGFAPVTSSVSFTIPDAVPEPATWATMLLGFGAIGFGLRQRAKLDISCS